MIVGLTGLIGSGKSTVAEFFAKHNVMIIDTDKIAHELTNSDHETLEKIRSAFGDGVFDGNKLNRQALRQLVFQDDKLRLKLEEILHPAIYEQVIECLQQPTSCTYKIVAVPLLFRSPKYLELVERTIFVDSNYEQLLQRLKIRSGLEKNDVDAILARQVARETQLALANDVIMNNGDLNSLALQVDKLHLQYTNMENNCK